MNFRRTAYIPAACAAILLLTASGGVHADGLESDASGARIAAARPDTPLGAAANPASALPPARAPELRSASGSPLLLEVTIPEPSPDLREIVVRTPRSSLRFAAPQTGNAGAAANPGPLELTLTPFLEPGVYDLEIELVGEASAARARYEVGFVDFVWGRDNFRFGNNRDYESRIGDYSDVLGEWLTERFGEPSEADLALLVHYMYSLFGENPGRCYAFTGMQLRYHRNSDVLPRYIDELYDVRMRSRALQREMNELQLDMVYDHFVSGGAPVGGRQSLLDIARELVHIRKRIRSGEPVVTGYISPDLHHAMLVYGYILDRSRGRVDLLVANNWKSGQDLNLRSIDAEVIRVDLRAGPGDPVLEWRNLDGPRRRAPERMFVMPVRESYDHARGPLDELVAARLTALRDDGRRVITVENAEAAWAEAGDGRATGYRDGRTMRGLEEVTLDRLKQTTLLDFPRKADLRIGFSPSPGETVRLFYLDPGTAAGEERGLVQTVSPPAAGAGARAAGDGEEEPPVYFLELGPEGARLTQPGPPEQNR